MGWLDCGRRSGSVSLARTRMTRGGSMGDMGENRQYTRQRANKGREEQRGQDHRRDTRQNENKQRTGKGIKKGREEKNRRKKKERRTKGREEKRRDVQILERSTTEQSAFKRS